MDMDQGNSGRRQSAQDATNNLLDILNTSRNRKGDVASGEGGNDTLAHLRNKNVSEEYMKQFPRRWVEGDLYTPRELGPREAKKWRSGKAQTSDPIDALGLRPLDMYRVSFACHTIMGGD
jgi:hypothetical protein